MLSDFASLMKGGKSGAAIDQGELMKSELIRRMLLPAGDEDHMPPEDEDQLTKEEITTISSWIEEGASSELLFSQLEASNPLFSIAQNKIKSQQLNKWGDLPTVSDEKIADLSSDYCNILRMYTSSNALQVLIFPNKDYSPELLQKLKPIAKNIIELNLSNLPLDEQEMKTLSTFSNIEKLNVSSTPIDDDLFTRLGSLEKLEFLKMYNTKVSAASTAHFLSFINLKEVYLYGTAFEPADIEKLKEKNTVLHVVSISEASLDFRSVLPAPTFEPKKYFFKDPFYARLEHPLAEIDVNYTVDGSNPDVNSPKLLDSIFIEDDFTMKYFVSKAGWEPSPVDSVSFIKSTHQPVNYKLKFQADNKYLGIGKSLFFDLVKGSSNFGDDSWMAFRDNRFILTCEFDEEIVLDRVILSSMVHTDPYIFPPSSIKIEGGTTRQNMKPLGSLKPNQPKDKQSQHFKFYDCTLKSESVKYIQITVQPLEKLPKWHRDMGKVAWFFIDEVVFQEKKAGIIL
jgi:hypothetical protein